MCARWWCVWGQRGSVARWLGGKVARWQSGEEATPRRQSGGTSAVAAVWWSVGNLTDLVEYPPLHVDGYYHGEDHEEEDNHVDHEVRRLDLDRLGVHVGPRVAARSGEARGGEREEGLS